MVGVVRRWLLLAMGLVAAGAQADGIEIDVVGLFRDAALFEINGRRQLLRAGEQSVEGVLLISAHSREAIIELAGRRLTLNLSSRIGADFQQAVSTSVSIGLNDLGQYRTTGSINDRPVALLVDTGANVVAMNQGVARRLGIDYEVLGTPTEVATAGGVVKSWSISLDVVQVGDIRVRNVRAVVLEGEHPSDILLGRTFLANVEMKESAGVLVLTSKL